VETGPAGSSESRLSHPLGEIALFADLPDADRAALASTMRSVTLAAGDALFHQGDRGEDFFVVVHGELDVVSAMGTPEELVLGRVCAGECLGEMSLLLPDGQRTASVRARRESRLLALGRTQFFDLVLRHPSVARSITRVLSRRLASINDAAFRDLTAKNRSLEEALTALRAAQAKLVEQERLEREIEVAAEIQRSILPDRVPQRATHDFGARMIPARRVGGDFFDFFDLGEERIGIVIGDVADKGIPSAIFMARAHALIVAEAHRRISPGEVLRAVNEHITRLDKAAQFVTALYGILDLRTSRFVYARAGHEPPLVALPNGGIHRPALGAGMALGFAPEIRLDESALEVPPGGCLLLYTDGVTDCRDPHGEAFGRERASAVISASRRESAQRVCDDLVAAVVDFQAGAAQDDDVTLVAVRHRSPESSRLRSVT
jgi:sigma-B regulation protein RsbU (phosphoserine phosphatase)